MPRLSPLQKHRSRKLRREMTGAERTLWQMLRLRQFSGFKFRRQHPIDVFIADFACLEARLVVEIDGGQHAEDMAQDERRTQALLSAGFVVLRLWNHEVLTEQESVGNAIWNALLERSHAQKQNPIPTFPLTGGRSRRSTPTSCPLTEK